MRFPFAFLIPILLCACIGPAADDFALFGPAANAWPAVEEDYLRGIDDGVADADLSSDAADVLRLRGDELGDALAEKDRHAVRVVPWTSMEPWAERGIADKVDDGEVGPGVAVSLLEQLRLFGVAIGRLQGGL